MKFSLSGMIGREGSLATNHCDTLQCKEPSPALRCDQEQERDSPSGTRCRRRSGE